MSLYFVRRILLIIPTFLGATFLAFLITRFVPGGPFEQAVMEMKMGAGSRGAATADLPEAALAELKKSFDLDKSTPEAYVRWLGRMLRLDMGQSYRYRQPVWEVISSRFPVSIYFGLIGFFLSYLICVPLGIAKALRHGGVFDFASSVLVFIGYSIPGWALGVLLLSVFASQLEKFPLGGFRTDAFDQLPQIIKEWEVEGPALNEFGEFDWSKMSLKSKALDQLHHTTLPIIAYMIGGFASLTVLTKNSLLETLGQDYIRTAYAKGLRPTRIIYLHALRNSLIPIATGLGHALSLIMAGSFLIESVFNIQGIGFLGLESIRGRDYPVVMGILSINIMLNLIGNIISDLLYALIDPRIRFD